MEYIAVSSAQPEVDLGPVRLGTPVEKYSIPISVAICFSPE